MYPRENDSLPGSRICATGLHDEGVVGSRIEDRGEKSLANGGEDKGQERKGKVLVRKKEKKKKKGENEGGEREEEDERRSIYTAKRKVKPRDRWVCKRAKKCRCDDAMGDQVDKILVESSDSRPVHSQNLKRIRRKTGEMD